MDKNNNPEDKICSKHGITQDDLINYFTDQTFCEYLDLLNIKRIKKAEALLAKKAIPAILTLAYHFNNEKGEVARKAAADIITRFQRANKSISDNSRTKNTQKAEPQLSEEQAREMLLKFFKAESL